MAISHPTSTPKSFSFIFWLVHALFGHDPRDESGKTTASQNDIKARFSIEDGIYTLDCIL